MDGLVLIFKTGFRGLLVFAEISGVAARVLSCISSFSKVFSENLIRHAALGVYCFPWIWVPMLRGQSSSCCFSSSIRQIYSPKRWSVKWIFAKQMDKPTPSLLRDGPTRRRSCEGLFAYATLTCSLTRVGRLVNCLRDYLFWWQESHWLFCNTRGRIFLSDWIFSRQLLKFGAWHLP